MNFKEAAKLAMSNMAVGKIRVNAFGEALDTTCEAKCLAMSVWATAEATEWATEGATYRALLEARNEL